MTDARLNERYRSESRFSEKTMASIRYSILFMSHAKKFATANNIEYNLTKASTLSWLYLTSSSFLLGRIQESDFSSLNKAFFHLENSKAAIRKNERISQESLSFLGLSESIVKEILFLYIERSSSRVMSTGSVLIRDIIINIFCSKTTIDLLETDDINRLTTLIKQLSQEEKADTKSIIETCANDWRSHDEIE